MKIAGRNRIFPPLSIIMGHSTKHGLDWTGQLDWTVGLDSWTGLLDWDSFLLNRRNSVFLRKVK